MSNMQFDQASRANRCLFPITPEPEVVPCYEPQSQDGGGLTSGLLALEGGVLCPYFLKNPHLLPESSPCRKGFDNVSDLLEHIEQGHKRPLPSKPNGITELEKFRAVWGFLFPNDQGTIPHPRTCDRESLRKLQNSRLLELQEEWIKGQFHLRGFPEIANVVGSICKDYRNKMEAFCLPLRTPSASRNNTTTSIHSATPSETIGSSESEVETPSDVSTQIGSGTMPPDLVESVLNPMKRDIVNRLMKTIGEIFKGSYATDEDTEDSDSSDDSYAPVCTFEESDRHSIEATLKDHIDVDEQPSQNSNNTIHKEQEQPHSTANPNLRKGKRGADDSGSNDGNERGGGKKQKQESPNGDGASGSVKKFSCPYFKYNPQRPRKHTSCRHPGFPNVSRVKEHLYRIHPPIHLCPICYKIFDGHDRVLQHVRDQQCTKSTEKPDTESMTTDQERELRKKDRKTQSEEERWRKVYRILFPLDENTATPSPYYEVMDHELLGRFNEYCLKWLPRLLKKRLMCEVEKQLRDTIIMKLQECQESLFASFQRGETGTQEIENEVGIDVEQDLDSFDLSGLESFWFANMD